MFMKFQALSLWLLVASTMLTSCVASPGKMYGPLSLEDFKIQINNDQSLKHRTATLMCIVFDTDKVVRNKEGNPIVAGFVIDNDTVILDHPSQASEVAYFLESNGIQVNTTTSGDYCK
jgi:hypothetical protein